MLRLGLPAILVVALMILWVYCILDVIATDAALIRNMPKMVWLVIVFFVPDIGSIAWLALGRPAYAGWRPGDTDYRSTAPRSPAVRGPEDDPRFSPRRDADAAQLQAWEDDLARRERELRRQGELPRGEDPMGTEPTA